MNPAQAERSPPRIAVPGDLDSAALDSWAGCRAERIRRALPEGGLFAGQDWRVAPAPFELGASLGEELEKLGRVLLQFNRAANLLYRLSVEGRQPGWVAEWLDRGKPKELVALQRHPAWKRDLPRVIRPDILLTEGGARITEMDSVPGGMGLTAWLQAHYSVCAAGCDRDRGSAESGGPGCGTVARAEGRAGGLIGGARGMLEGFAGIFGSAEVVHIVVSEEAATYRPEMEWLAAELNRAGVGEAQGLLRARPGGGGRRRYVVQDGRFSQVQAGEAVYRFFELFDLENVPGSRALFEAATEGRAQLTPAPKPLFEEKLLLALLWNRNLAEYWRQELGAGFLRELRVRVPYTWVVDPAPLPPHGAIPELGLTDWRQLKGLSQRERALILKVSGFSELAWGARSVVLGSDVSAGEWAAAVDRALEGFSRTPYVLQRYEKPRSVEAAWYDFAGGRLRTMTGRVRLCPYYFVTGDGDSARAGLGGVLATICPADKKIIHGMPEAILAPCGA